MAQRILIDLMKMRKVLIENPGLNVPEALYYKGINENGLKTIRELAIFSITCRKCEDAPCIAACPADALEKDSAGVITRHTNLCISCKSCVTICPFGTMMTDFFKHHRNKDLYYDLKEKTDLEKYIKEFPEGTVSIVESGERPSENIYRLNDYVLIRDYMYSTIKE
jgi:Fe-S-cluster-containing hydrogenase component 2